METAILGHRRPAIERSPSRVYRMWEDEFLALPAPVKAAARGFAIDVWYEGDRVCFLCAKGSESYFEMYFNDPGTAEIYSMDA